MTVSFVIVSYNTRDLTLACLNSLAKFEKKSQIVVVDNHSHDDSVVLIRKRFPQVQLITSDQNLGFSRANNLAIHHSQGQFIILLNSDTQLTGPISAALISHFYSASIGASVPRLLNPDNSSQASVFHLPTLALAIKEYWLGQIAAFSKYTPSQDTPSPVEAAVMACMCIPRSVFDQIGLLNENYFMYFEDLEFARRLRQHGLKIIYDPQVTLIHHHGASGKSHPDGWKRLIPGSKRYHGLLTHYLINFVLWSGQKFSSRR